MNNLTQSPKNPGSAAAPTAETCALSPAVNIIETKDSFVLEAEMPGVRKEGLEILLEGHDLTVIGRRGVPRAEGVEFLHRESRARDFRRGFSLDPCIDTTRIHARIDQGLLVLTMPKAESVKPRRIEVGG